MPREPGAKCGYPSSRFRGFTCTRNPTATAPDGRRVCKTHLDIIIRDTPAKPRPTIGVMTGGETGEASTCDPVLDTPPEFLEPWVCSWSCTAPHPAPTPEAP